LSPEAVRRAFDATEPGVEQARQEEDALWHCLKSQQPRAAELVGLRYTERVGIADLADLLGTTPSAIYQELSRSEVFLKEPGIMTFRPWELDESEVLVREVVWVRPDLMTRPVAIDGQKAAAAEAGPSEAGGDQFVGMTEGAAVPRLTPIELFSAQKHVGSSDGGDDAQ